MEKAAETWHHKYQNVPHQKSRKPQGSHGHAMIHMEPVDGNHRNRHHYKDPEKTKQTGHRGHMHSPHRHRHSSSFVEEAAPELHQDPQLAKLDEIHASMMAQTKKFEDEAKQDALLEEQFIST